MKKILVLIILLISFISAIFVMQKPETDILKAFISPNANTEINLINLLNISNKQLNIIIESDNIQNLAELKSYFEDNNFSEIEILDVYKKYPGNFISEQYRELLQNKQYSMVAKKGKELLYNPLGFYINTPDKDPYLLSTNFVLQNSKLGNGDILEYDNKFYVLVHTEKDVKTVLKTIEETDSLNIGTVYLTGTPIHSYQTAKASSIEINIICILSSLALILMCKLKLKSLKILLPIILSILFGILCGFTFSVLCFKKLHILTFVFSTSLIGISLDYSLHYFLSDKTKTFWKSLFVSMLTTVFGFLILYFSNIVVLQQIAIFSVSGLIGVYLFVKYITPIFSIKLGKFKIRNNKFKKYKKLFLFVVITFIFIGGFNLKFTDDIKTFYSPSKKLMASEQLYKKLFNPAGTNFIPVSGSGIDDILVKEEQIVEELNKKNIKSISLSNFISSSKRQKENIELTKALYNTNLDSYADFLDKNTKEKLKNSFNIYDVSNFPLNKKFMLNDTTSFVLINSKIPDFQVINVTDEISKILKNFRCKFLILLPVVFLLIYLILCVFYPPKKSIQIILPSLLGTGLAISLLGMVQDINIFHLLAIILILGFSLDYSIFRIEGDKNSELAVLMSCISTVLSFTLLGFTSFKLISSLGAVLAIGILTSYILSLVFIKGAQDD